MTGQIHLNMLNHFSCASLVIEITGEEKIKFTTKDKTKDREDYDKKSKAKNTFLHICHILHRFDNKLAMVG